MLHKNKKEFNPRKYMEMAVAVMKKSVHEPRADKKSPKVGVVLMIPDGSIETAARGDPNNFFFSGLAGGNLSLFVVIRMI